MGNRSMQFDLPHMQQEIPKIADASPLVDVIDDGNFVHVVLQMSGIRKEDIKITAKPEQISVSVHENKNSYTRTINMPCMIDAKYAEAKYNNGVLELFLKKIHSESFDVEIK